MNTNKIGILIVLSLSIAAVASGTTAMNFVTPVFAGGDHHHHDHGDKKCKDNGDNNCNDKLTTQKITAKNECEIENNNKDHSSKNDNTNGLDCSNQAQNLKDVVQVFGSTDGLDGVGAESTQVTNQTQ